MKMYVGITDYDWFTTLKQGNYEEINFWKPGGTNFKALDAGDLFLFKLHSPNDYIVGGGFFLKASILPTSLAWDAFGIGNGVKSLRELNDKIQRYRKTTKVSNSNLQIGCVILTSPFYFDENEWIPVPSNWSRNIVQGKTYVSTEFYGELLYQQVQESLSSRTNNISNVGEYSTIERYGAEQIIRPRIGQGAFKVLITEVYRRQCAVTGEKTLPVLDAAHIKPYSLEGPHEIKNGILLRKDIHTLFDRGYITIDRKMNIEVSSRIKEDFGNGREYYSHHGNKLIVLPNKQDQLPGRNYLEWHNENVYLG